VNARQSLLMAGAFGLTFVLLVGVFLGLQSMAQDPERVLVTPGPTLIGVAGTPAPFRTRAPAGTPRPLTTRPPTPTRKPGARPSIAPAGSPGATTEPVTATIPADGVVRVVLRGDQYELADIPENGTLTPVAGGGIRLETTRLYSHQLMVTWFVPPDAIPAGATATRVDVAVCGRGDGDFYETYGPEGSDPTEHEVEPPSADGCWHYNGAIGDDTSVIAIVRLASSLTIDRVEYTLTLE
jgi:hypothetical protein